MKLTFKVMIFILNYLTMTISSVFLPFNSLRKGFISYALFVLFLWQIFYEFSSNHYRKCLSCESIDLHNFIIIFTYIFLFFLFFLFVLSMMLLHLVILSGNFLGRLIDDGLVYKKIDY